MESKIILQFQEILYNRSWEISKKLPFSKQTQAKTALLPPKQKTVECKKAGINPEFWHYRKGVFPKVENQEKLIENIEMRGSNCEFWIFQAFFW